MYRTDAFPARYAGIEGQDELAESILAELPHLTWLRRKKIRKGLSALVGELPLALAEERVHLPEGIVDRDEVRNRRVVESLKAIHGDEVGRTKGLLSALIRTQNDQKDHAEAYERTLAVLDTMIRAARP